MDVNKMKITRILPKSLAIGWQEYDINKMKARYEYHQGLAEVFEQLLAEGEEELLRLQENK